MTANSARVNPTMDVTVSPSPLTGFLLDGPRIEVAQLMAQKPEAPLYVGVGSGLLAVRTAGIYAVTARLERPAGPVAQCLTRLGFGPYRIVSNFGVDMVSDIATTFNVARFDLQPGLYPIEWAFGCWHEGAETALGRLTVLIGHPGEPAPVLARADDIVRPRRTSP